MNFKVFVKAAIYELCSCWCLLRDDLIITRKFVFTWMVIASAYFINFRWLEFPGFLWTNRVIRIRKSIFVWILNVSVYFINCWWCEFQGFCRNNDLWHLWANYHIDASCVMTSSKPGNFGFTSIYLIIFL